MNETLRKGLQVRVPRIIRIDVNTDLVYRFKKMLDEHARLNPNLSQGKLAEHISHKLWILLYHSRFRGSSHKYGFTCLTGSWQQFCVKFLEDKLATHPGDPGLNQLLTAFANGKEVHSC